MLLTSPSSEQGKSTENIVISVDTINKICLDSNDIEITLTKNRSFVTMPKAYVSNANQNKTDSLMLASTPYRCPRKEKSLFYNNQVVIVIVEGDLPLQQLVTDQVVTETFSPSFSNAFVGNEASLFSHRRLPILA